MYANEALIRKLRADLKDKYVLREAIQTAKREFQARKDAEWKTLVASIRADHHGDNQRVRIRRALLELHEEGYTITKLCEVYGTKDRGTIMKALEKARVERGEFNPAKLNPWIRITPDKDGLFLVEVNDYSEWSQSPAQPYTGALVVGIDPNAGFPVVQDVPDHEKLAPLHKELAGGAKGTPFMDNWFECTQGQ